MRLAKKPLVYLLLLLFVCISLVEWESTLYEHSFLEGFTMNEQESEEFRSFTVEKHTYNQILEIAKTNKIPKEELLAALLFDYGYQLKHLSGQLKKSPEIALKSHDKKMQYKEKELEALAEACQKVIGDVKYFPVAASSTNPKATVAFENSWMSERTYGGTRCHEGCDIMAAINQRGYYPIVSMTDGVVENIGWLPKGGYRIGIRSTSGGYFYYAHLASYGNSLQKGDYVRAGDFLGYMGDTGYSEIEGTTGMFDVHLHVGIYITTAHYEELSINPYYVLKWAEDQKLTYDF